MVEGESDRGYFEFAANLYYAKHNRLLLGDELAIFPPGTEDDGGTFGIQRHFPTVRQIIDVDLSPDQKRLFSAIALLDNDSAGIHAARSLTGRHLRLTLYRDVFLLHPKLPMVSGTEQTVKSAIVAANAQWQGLECEIEDLLNPELIDCFLSEKAGHQPHIVHKNGRRHCSFAAHSKAPLLRYVKEYASLPDMVGIIDVLRGLRYYLNLDPDGRDATGTQP